MCSKPKVPKAQEKKPVYLSNPYLDGLSIVQNNRGRNSLRVDPVAGSGLAIPSTPRERAIAGK